MLSTNHAWEMILEINEYSHNLTSRDRRIVEDLERRLLGNRPLVGGQGSLLLAIHGRAVPAAGVRTRRREKRREGP